VIVLDCRGQRCPLPVIALAKSIRDAAVGDVVRVLADDPAAENDVPAWCRMKGQDLVAAGPGQFDVRRVS
jgi:tRNA 2-thiouridine synthesizing protein A